MIDCPVDRSLHMEPKARVGGVGLMIAASLSCLLLPDAWSPQAPWQVWLVSGTLMLFALSLADDIFQLPIGLRLATHVGVASAFLFAIEIEIPASATAPPWLIVGFVLGCIVWWTNLTNFMDGADGLAGGMSVIGFGILWLASNGHSGTGDQIGTIALTLSGASLGFLILNFPPAKIFLGDSGSIPLGFLAAALAVVGTLHQLWPWWFGLAVFSVFIVDATVTLARRILARKRFWQPHREHYYQRLILSGWSHRKTCLVYYFLMLASAICALFAKNSNSPWTWLLPLVITYASLIAVLEWRFHQEKKDGKKSGTG